MEDIVPNAPDKDGTAAAAPDLAALIGSRICHDLTNPLGAIGNGLELLELGGCSGSPEMALIAQSVAHARAQVQFLRVAFGAAGAGHRMGGVELSGLVADRGRGGRVRIDWPADLGAPRTEAKLVFLMLMCMETALPFGGSISVAQAEGRWRLLAEAERIRDLGPLWPGLAGRAALPEIAPPQVQFALALDTATRLGRTITVQEGDGSLILTS